MVMETSQKEMCKMCGNLVRHSVIARSSDETHELCFLSFQLAVYLLLLFLPLRALRIMECK